MSKPEPVRAVLGKESLKIPGKIDPKAKKNGAAGPDAAQPGTPPKEESDAPLLDLSDAAVRKMITRAKQRGYVTYDELNRVLPSDKVSSEQIEDTMAMLNEMGINVIESEEQEEGEGAEVPAVASGRQVAEVSREGRRDLRPHRRSRAHVFARDGIGRASVARRRNRDRETHRGRPRTDDRRAVRRTAHLRSAHRLARRAERRQGAAARHHRSRSDVWRRSRRRSAGRRARRSGHSRHGRARSASRARCARTRCERCGGCRACHAGRGRREAHDRIPARCSGGAAAAAKAAAAESRRPDAKATAKAARSPKARAAKAFPAWTTISTTRAICRSRRWKPR